MVSFCCDSCQEVMTKPKVEMHFLRCHPVSMSCIDCGIQFGRTSIKQHISCVSEAQKYGMNGSKSSNGIANGNGNTSGFCSTCQLVLNGAVAAEQHYQSKKHRASMRKEKIASKAETATAPMPAAPDVTVVEPATPPAVKKRHAENELESTLPKKKKQRNDRDNECKPDMDSRPKALERTNGIDVVTNGHLEEPTTPKVLVPISSPTVSSSSDDEKEKETENPKKANKSKTDKKSRGFDTPLKIKKMIRKKLEKQPKNKMDLDSLQKYVSKKLEKKALASSAKKNESKDKNPSLDDLIQVLAEDSDFVIKKNSARLSVSPGSKSMPKTNRDISLGKSQLLEQ